MNGYNINKDDSFMLLIDVQERLFNVMDDKIQEMLKKNCSILLSSCMVIDIPLIISEQYRKGLGSTIPELQDLSGDAVNLEKIHFDCTKDEELKKEITGLHKKTAIIAGIESHICVFQTSLSLLDMGYNVVVASDAVGSRRKSDWAMAMEMLSRAGALVYPTETIAFMLLEKAGTPEFKMLSPLFK